MEESAEEELKREETLRIYNSTKEALKIIGDVSRGTFTDLSTNRSSIIDLEDLEPPSLIEYNYISYFLTSV